VACGAIEIVVFIIIIIRKELHLHNLYTIVIFRNVTNSSTQKLKGKQRSHNKSSVAKKMVTETLQSYRPTRVLVVRGQDPIKPNQSIHQMWNL